MNELNDAVVSGFYSSLDLVGHVLRDSIAWCFFLVGLFVVVMFFGSLIRELFVLLRKKFAKIRNEVPEE